MNRILKYDAFKLEKSKYIYITFIISIFLNIMSIFSIEKVFEITNQINTDIFSFNSILFDNAFILLFLILICIFVSTDFKNGTIKNIATKGISRNEIFYSKLIWSIGLGILFIIVNFIVSLSIILFTQNVTIKPDEWLIIFKFLSLNILQIIYYSSLFVLISFFIRSSGSAIAISIGLQIFSPVIVTLIDFVVIKFDNFSFANLMPEYMSSLINQNLPLNSRSSIIFLISIIIQSILFAIIAKMNFNKKDIK